MSTVRLMESTSIGSLHLENRLVMLATHLSYCEEGQVSQKLIDFYVERARYRPGLIIIGGCYTEHLGMSTPTMIGISDDKHIPGLRNLVSEIHAYHVPVAAQLYHAGRYAHSLVLGESAVSASAVPCRLTRETPKELTLDEIQKTVSNFGAAAARAKSAGFDAVEILGSAGYLINQFLASVTNQRKDTYGGTLEARAKFAIEVVESVRKGVGLGFPVIYRMGGEDFVAGGNTLADNKKLAPWLVKAGIDCINVTGGWHETRVPQITMDVPRGHYAYLAEGIAESVRVPVIACNRINSATVAEHILSRGKVSLIGMSRGLIADPELPDKIRSGHPELVRPCIACNQGCLDRVFMIEPLECAINPEAGFEKERSLGPRGSGNIAVVGAGPAGMEVSRVLQLRGFNVTLYDSHATLGGLLRLAARIPGRGEFAAYVSHMFQELKRQGVGFRLGITANAASLLSDSYDCVVCATGTIPVSPPIDGVEEPHVMSACDVIELAPSDLGRVSVIGGGMVGCYTALFLASNAESVDLFEASDRIGAGLGRSTRWVILKSMHEKGVQIHKNTEVSQITSRYLLAVEAGESSTYSADTVVAATGSAPRDRLVEQLRHAGMRVETVGSLGGAGSLLECIHQAYKFANALSL